MHPEPQAQLGRGYNKLFHTLSQQTREREAPINGQFMPLDGLWPGESIDIESKEGKKIIHIVSRTPDGRYIGWDVRHGNPVVLTSDKEDLYRIQKKLRPYYLAIIKSAHQSNGSYKECKSPGGYFTSEQEAIEFHGKNFICLVEEPVMLQAE
jgi:hypothetical protein